MAQSVRCPTHGFYYDPDEVDGCVKCLEAPEPGRSASEVEPSGRGGSSFSIVSLFVWLVVLSAVGWGGVRFVRYMGDRGGEIAAETAKTAGRIDPTLVRSQIEVLEALVYPTQPAAFGQGGSIQRASMVLYSGIMRATSALAGSLHGRKIVGFGSKASQYDDVGYGTTDLTRVQRDWEQVRAEVFHDADWYRSSGN